MPETADYTYSTVPRRCGGSHTLTYPYRRSRLQHPSQGLCPTEEIQIAMKVGRCLGATREGPEVALEHPPEVPSAALGLGAVS